MKFMELALVRINFILGLALVGPNLLIALSFLGNWDGHVGAFVLFVSLIAVVVGSLFLLTWQSFLHNWRLRWVVQLLPLMIALWFWRLL